MPLIETKGAASAQGFGEFAASSAGAITYIEDVFSTWLYTGTGTTNPIVNSIDLSTKGGMVWLKNRGTGFHNLTDTARGVTSQLSSNSTAASSNYSAFQSFNTTGFTVYSGDSYVNQAASNYASWTFRKQPKFFDIVTYTGNGVAGRTIAHSLGSVPGCMIVKRYSTSGIWPVYHRSLTSANYYMQLESTVAQAPNSGYWNNTAPTDTVFTVGNDGDVNGSGISYVAYLFAHNAGGFGLTGTDNVISCGSYTGNTTTFPTVTVGFEPQWLLVRRADAANDWIIMDNMRGFANSTSGGDSSLFPNTASTEDKDATLIGPTSTGFVLEGSAASVNANGGTYIYVAIRRGPMKVPTDATKIFTPIAATPATDTLTSIAVTPDVFLFKGKNINDPFWTEDRIRKFNLVNTSSSQQLQVNSTAAQQTQLPIAYYIQNTDMYWGGYLDGTASIIYNFKRAPSVFDEVCYTGDGGSNRALSHNLQVVPELVIYKRRSGIADWLVWTTSQTGKGALLNTTDAFFTNANTAGTSTWTSSTIYIKNAGFDGASTNGSGSTYVAYLFATCAGVSKVGSYTGTGSTQTISCGFTGGARFVLIKRTDSTGSWWVWDTARGMVSGNDKRLALNTTASEVNANWVYTTTGGFQIVTSDAEVNASGGTYIFLAMA